MSALPGKGVKEVISCQIFGGQRNTSMSRAQHIARELRVDRTSSEPCVPYGFGLSPSHPSRPTRGISARDTSWILDFVSSKLGINILIETIIRDLNPELNPVLQTYPADWAILAVGVSSIAISQYLITTEAQCSLVVLGTNSAASCMITMDVRCIAWL
jgi:hypothetical protein